DVHSFVDRRAPAPEIDVADIDLMLRERVRTLQRRDLDVIDVDRRAPGPGIDVADIDLRSVGRAIDVANIDSGNRDAESMSPTSIACLRERVRTLQRRDL